MNKLFCIIALVVATLSVGVVFYLAKHYGQIQELNEENKPFPDLLLFRDSFIASALLLSFPSFVPETRELVGFATLAGLGFGSLVKISNNARRATLIGLIYGATILIYDLLAKY